MCDGIYMRDGIYSWWNIYLWWNIYMHDGIYTRDGIHAWWNIDVDRAVWLARVFSVTLSPLVFKIVYWASVTQFGEQRESGQKSEGSRWLGVRACCQHRRHGWVQSLGGEDPLEKELATSSSSCLGNAMDRGAMGLQKSWTWLND